MKRKSETIETAYSGGVFAITCKGDQAGNFKSFLPYLVAGTVFAFFSAILWLRSYRFLSGSFNLLHILKPA